jgi:hypothetical protein
VVELLLSRPSEQQDELSRIAVDGDNPSNLRLLTGQRASLVEQHGIDLSSEPAPGDRWIIQRPLSNPGAGSMVSGALLQFPEHLVVVLRHGTYNTRCAVQTCGTHTTNRSAVCLVWLVNQLLWRLQNGIAPRSRFSFNRFNTAQHTGCVGTLSGKTIGYFAINLIT